MPTNTLNENLVRRAASSPPDNSKPLRELGRALIPRRREVRAALREVDPFATPEIYRRLAGRGITRPMQSCESEEGELVIVEEENLPIFHFLLSRELRRQSRWAYRGHVYLFYDWLDHPPSQMTQTTRADVEDFLRSECERISQGTVRLRFQVIRIFFRWAEKTGRIGESPVEDLRPSTVPGVLFDEETLDEHFTSQ